MLRSVHERITFLKMLEIIHQITSHNHSRQNLVYHNVKVNSVATFRLD